MRRCWRHAWRCVLRPAGEAPDLARETLYVTGWARRLEAVEVVQVVAAPDPTGWTLRLRQELVEAVEVEGYSSWCITRAGEAQRWFQGTDLDTALVAKGFGTLAS